MQFNFFVEVETFSSTITQTLHPLREITVTSLHRAPYTHIHIQCFVKAASLQFLNEYTSAVSVAHSLAVSDVIVNYLVLLRQLLIAPLVLWGLGIQHRNNTASSIRQSLSVGDTSPVVWLSIRTGLVTVFTCGLSTFFRLILHKPDWPFSVYFPPHFSSAPSDSTRNRLLALYRQCNNMIQTKKTKSFYFLFFQKVGSIHCAAEVAPTKTRKCKLLFYTLCLWKKLQIEDTSNREPEHFDLTLNAMKLCCIKI